MPAVIHGRGVPLGVSYHYLLGLAWRALLRLMRRLGLLSNLDSGFPCLSARYGLHLLHALIKELQAIYRFLLVLYVIAL